MPARARAAEAATPDEPPIETTTTTSNDVWSNWRYLGEHQLTYAAIPVTVEPGDIIHHPGLPADDGRWESTDDEATRRRDNHQEG